MMTGLPSASRLNSVLPLIHSLTSAMFDSVTFTASNISGRVCTLNIAFGRGIGVYLQSYKLSQPCSLSVIICTHQFTLLHFLDHVRKTTAPHQTVDVHGFVVRDVIELHHVIRVFLPTLDAWVALFIPPDELNHRAIGTLGDTQVTHESNLIAFAIV